MKTSRSLLTSLAAVLFSSQLFAASTTISSLPAASSVAPTNLTIVVDLTEPNPNLQTKKANVTQLVDGLPAASSGAKGTMSAADKIKLDAATSAATVNAIVRRDSSGNAAFNSIALSTGTVSTSPVNPTDITNKAYVDAVSTGLAVHTPAVAATTGTNISLTGGAPNTLDGVTLASSDRILVKDQTDPKQNGIYTVSVLGSGANGTWVRASDANSGSNLVSGSYIFINGGTTWASSAWVMTTPGAIVIGTSDINWTLFNQVTNILASNIIGQIVQAQIADAAINTAKFAAGIEPVSVVSSLPSPSGYTGPRAVFSTSDSKLYRYNGTAFTVAVDTTDLSGTITNTQIADNSISTPKLQANAVTAAKIAANTITANEIAADTITAGQIAAGAVNTSELAANAVTAAKISAGTITATQIASATILGSNIAAGTITASNIQANTITADRLNVSTLSAISANLGTVTAGTLSSVTITSTSGSISGFTLSSNEFSNSATGTQKMKMGYGGQAHILLGDTTGYSGPSTEYTNTDVVMRHNSTGFVDANLSNVNGYGDLQLCTTAGTRVAWLTGAGTGVIGSGRGYLAFQSTNLYETGSGNIKTDNSLTVGVFLTVTSLSTLTGGFNAFANSTITGTLSVSGTASLAAITTTGGITGPGPASATILGYKIETNPSTSNHSYFGVQLDSGSDGFSYIKWDLNGGGSRWIKTEASLP